MDEVMTMSGILGFCFAILLVLAVLVAIILDPLTLIRPLRKKVSPEGFLRDINDWLRSTTQEKFNAIALINIAKEFNIDLEEVQT